MPKTAQFVTPDGPPLVAAAGLAVALMNAAKVETWSDLGENWPDVLLTDEQTNLLRTYEYALLPLVKGLHLYACPVCGMFGYTESTTAPSACMLTHGCPGKPVREKAAIKVKDRS